MKPADQPVMALLAHSGLPVSSTSTRSSTSTSSNYDAVSWAVITDALFHHGPFDPTRFDPATCAKDFMPGVTATEAVGRQYVIYENGGPLLFGFAWRKVDAEPPLRCYARPDGCPAD